MQKEQKKKEKEKSKLSLKISHQLEEFAATEESSGLPFKTLEDIVDGSLSSSSTVYTRLNGVYVIFSKRNSCQLPVSMPS
jgi:hypothetical protein